MLLSISKFVFENKYKYLCNFILIIFQPLIFLNVFVFLLASFIDLFSVVNKQSLLIANDLDSLHAYMRVQVWDNIILGETKHILE